MIAVISGGMDSLTMLCELKGLGEPGKQIRNLEAVSFYYGQRHRRELEFAKAQCKELEMPWTLVDISNVGSLLTGSALTDDKVAVPHGHYEDESMKATVVSNRNSIMLNIAAGIARSRGHSAIATAVHAGDHAVYPDCRPEFIESLQQTLRIAMDLPDFEVHAPYVKISKTDIAMIGGVLGVPYHLSWSCYEGGAIHCGKCGTCVERREAFSDGLVTDPTVYED
jgi:7-cyano-7-deazaguanine synthase